MPRRGPNHTAAQTKVSSEHVPVETRAKLQEAWEHSIHLGGIRIVAVGKEPLPTLSLCLLLRPGLLERGASHKAEPVQGRPLLSARLAFPLKTTKENVAEQGALICVTISWFLLGVVKRPRCFQQWYGKPAQSLEESAFLSLRSRAYRPPLLFPKLPLFGRLILSGIRAFCCLLYSSIAT